MEGATGEQRALEVSVVAATFRRPHLLEQLLASLVEQSLPKDRFEVVIVDDGSGDHTLETLAAWQKRGDLHLRFVSQENSGPAAARNRGYRMAAAPLIAFTDDDCVAEAEWLERLVAYMRDHPEVSGVGGSIHRREERLLSRFVDYVARMGHKVRQGTVLVLITANACYRRAALDEVGGFDERIPWPEGEDPDLSRKILEKGGLLAVEESARIGHSHRDSVRGIFKDGKLAGIGTQFRMSLGTLDRKPDWHIGLGMLRNHFMRTLRAPTPFVEKPVFAWLSVVKTVGVLVGMRAYRKMVSPENLEARNVNTALGGASTLKGSGTAPKGPPNQSGG